MEAITELLQQHGCSQDLLGVVLASTNDALSTMTLAYCEGRSGDLQKGGPCQRRSLFFSDLQRYDR